MKHEHCANDEIFLGNLKGEIPDYLLPIKSLRLGSQALDINGDPIPAAWGMRPMFVKRGPDADQYDRIMMQRFRAIRGWSKESGA